jgi:hypothetical protein
MNTTNKYCIALAASLLLVAGCASHKRKPTPRLTPSQAVIQVIPPQGRPEPKVAPINDKASPVYQNPIIEEVDQSPYINEDGNLVFPAKMLVIRQAGHWNLEAAKRNTRYYIPADNTPPQLLPPSKSYYDYTQSKKNGAAFPAKQIDVSSVRVTGFTQKEEEASAKAALLSGETLAFDPNLGWIALPNPLLQKQGSIATPSEATQKLAPPESKAPEDQTQLIVPAGVLPAPKAVPAGVTGQSGDRDQDVKKLLEDAFRAQNPTSGTSTNRPQPKP